MQHNFLINIQRHDFTLEIDQHLFEITTALHWNLMLKSRKFHHFRNIFVNGFYWRDYVIVDETTELWFENFRILFLLSYSRSIDIDRNQLTPWISPSENALRTRVWSVDKRNSQFADVSVTLCPKLMWSKTRSLSEFLADLIVECFFFEMQQKKTESQNKSWFMVLNYNTHNSKKKTFESICDNDNNNQQKKKWTK